VLTIGLLFELGFGLRTMVHIVGDVLFIHLACFVCALSISDLSVIRVSWLDSLHTAYNLVGGLRNLSPSIVISRSHVPIIQCGGQKSCNLRL
jgi:hypothetical protein